MQVAGCPQDVGHGHGPMNPSGGILHRSYGGWGGDVATVRNSGLAHFVVGKDEGQWVQLADTTEVTYSVGNWQANNATVAIEFTGTNEEPLTDWQARAGGEIIRQVSAAHGIEVAYNDGSEGPVYNGPWVAWRAHRGVHPDQGTQHTDFITAEDWPRMMGATPPAPGGSGAVADDGLLSSGDSGPAVAHLQQQLKAQGANLQVDGDFGPLTDAAVRHFQSAHGLDVDGIVGPQTQAALG